MSHGYGKESHAINEGIKGGDAGKRIGCAVIGYSKENFKC